MRQRIAVIGAGIVGVTTALELQKQNYRVTLIDRNKPAQETSRWNAGVVARSSLVPFNGPNLLQLLPKAMFKQLPGVRINWQWALSHPQWLYRFVLSGLGPSHYKSILALNSLIEMSSAAHRELLSETESEQLLVDRGWMFLYNSKTALDGHRQHREIYEQYGIDYSVLSAGELRDLEPALRTDFEAATWIKDTFSVSDPQHVVERYFDKFIQLGGSYLQADAKSIKPIHDGYHVLGLNNENRHFEQVVVATGAWSECLLRDLALHPPLAVERGYVMRYELRGEEKLHRPMCDVSGGYVLSPRDDDVQISTGVELTGIDRKPLSLQLELAETRARDLLDLGVRRYDEIPVGNRPTLPDSLPMIGPVTHYPGLWLAFGHQHVGFSTGPGTAKILAAQISKKPTPINAEPFSPSRFGL